MTNRRTLTTEQEIRFNSYMATLLEVHDQGHEIGPEELSQQHPDLADEIAEFLDADQGCRQMAGPLRQLYQSTGAFGDVRPAGPNKATPPRATPSGTTTSLETGVLGDFRLIREVGRGGMGVVYEAEQISLGRRVALKVLPFAAALDGKQLIRFKNEALAAAQLDHPSIVDVFGVGCERGVHFYAMRFVEGQNLAEVIHDLQTRVPIAGAAAIDAAGKEASLEDPVYAVTRLGSQAIGPQSVVTSMPSTTPQARLSTLGSCSPSRYYRLAAEIGAQVADALDYAHERGIVHRDIKPSNLIVDARGKVWVADFGLAQIQNDSRLTVSGDLIGTLRYMSPEQALAKRIPIDHRTDIYSLGVTLYELLTLQPVYRGEDRQELLRQIAFEEPVPPRKLDKSIPTELETIVLKAIEKNPAERYGSTQEMAADLRAFLTDQPIKARRPTWTQELSRWGRKHRALVNSALAILVLAVIGLSASTAMIAAQQRETSDALEDRTQALHDRTRALGERDDALAQLSEKHE